MIFHDLCESIQKVCLCLFQGFPFGKNLWQLIEVAGETTFRRGLENRRELKPQFVHTHTLVSSCQPAESSCNYGAAIAETNRAARSAKVPAQKDERTRKYAGFTRQSAFSCIAYK